MTLHTYDLNIQWTGNNGKGTFDYDSYQRSYTISAKGKDSIRGSADVAFSGDQSCYNPEELLLASLSGCHMLWFLHLCADAGVIVLDYTDRATGTMEETGNGGGHFTGVILNPVITVVNPNMVEKANALHRQANKRCYIASSVNFPVNHKPVYIVAV